MDHKDLNPSLLESIDFSLKEINKLVRLISTPLIKDILEKTLNTKDKRLVYSNMDGEKSVTSIQELTKVNVRYISEWGQDWEKIGIVESESNSSVRGRRKKLYDLTLFDVTIDIPENKINEG
ncbi:MAG: hypothetical protein ACD_19C00230G0003 [uncultured bacterium]|nr:MAG: hypothetical protein ACD_19C00230G0003 [uncultured bacterium]HCS40912.1 hypothetical protein [Anaerolineaceae bacterium]